MAKPIVKRISPFDATKDYTVEIAWTGNRSYSNKIVITDAESNGKIYEDKVTTFSLKHVIPANTLTNGKNWVIQASTFDVNGAESAMSDKLLFYTLSTPTFSFSNLEEGDIVSDASLQASIYYSSPELEDISSYSFYLYDSTKRQLFHSEQLTDDSDINYTYRGLSNNTDYYIRCTGVTVNGIELDTGYLRVSVKYENPNNYARIYATNVPEQGCIQVATNLVVLQYNGTEQFEYEDGKIDLQDKTLVYDDGFIVEDDFTLILRGINLWQNATLLSMSNGQRGLELTSHIYSDGQLRFRLVVPNGISEYMIYSDVQVFDNTDLVAVVIRKKDNIYQLKVFVEYGYRNTGNIWYGTNKPTKADTNDYWLDVEQELMKVDPDEVTSTADDEPTNVSNGDLWFGI